MNLFQADDDEFSSTCRNKVEMIRAEARSAETTPSSFIQSTNTTRRNFSWTQKTLRLFTFYHLHQRCTPISVGHELRQRRRAFHWRARRHRFFLLGEGARALKKLLIKGNMGHEARAGTWESLLETQAERVHEGAFPSGSRHPISGQMRDGALCWACSGLCWMWVRG